VVIIVVQSGLGLAISRTIAELLGGSLVCSKTECGVGSCFTLRVPYLPCEPEEVDIPPPPPQRDCLRGRKALVVDDSEINSKLYAKMLERFGAETRATNDSRQALRLFRENPFDLVLVDIYMPDLDGIELTKQIMKCRQGRNGNKPIVIGITGDSTQEVRARCLRNGMADVILKPSAQERIITVILKCLSPKADSRSEETPTK
jgi:CheY-like chemotaxis protein